MSELTPQQREAIERRDGPLFVRAGAGSGKTRVLVERFVATVAEDGVPVDRVLAITFTDKAAAEMRSRVRARLLALGDRDRARAAETAAISTIHAFCSRLLRANALAAGLDPEFAVLDEPAAARLEIDAFDQALDAFLAEETGSQELDLAAAHTPDKLRRMVTTVYRRLRSRGEREPSLPPIDPPRPAGERDRLAHAVSEAMRELGGRAGEAGNIDRALGALGECESALAALGDLPDPDDVEELKVKPGPGNAFKTPAFDEFREAHAAFVAYCAAARAARDHPLLARLLELFGARYTELKDERSALDFDDLELRARDLLRDEPAIRDELRERFAAVMVDEFQDTNKLQIEILDLIGEVRLFVVGDQDQSIYGFRHADVGLFRERRDRAEADGRATALRENFRSRPEILGAIDLAFGSVWPDFDALVPPPGGAESAPRTSPCVELLLVDNSKARWVEALGEEPFGRTLADVPLWRAAEARLLARRISELAGPGKPFGWSETAVLIRAGTDMHAYERALAEVGVPTYAHGGRGFGEAQQVADLRAYLAALANPLDELALVSLLATPLAGVSLGSIACLRLRSRKLGRGLWWALEQAFLPGGDGSDGLADALPDGDRERLVAFTERFARERAAAPRLSLESLIDRAVTESGYDRVILAMPAGDRRLANVRKLMRVARQFEADGGRDVRRFIDHLDERDLVRAREGEAPMEGESREPAVRLMTVHAAKGLEFPLVCVADLGRHARGDSGGGLEVSEDGRVGLRLATLSGESHGALEWDRLKEEQARRDEEEEKRIFYVAMTRAQEHLVLSGAVDARRWPQPKPLGEPIDWIWRAVAPGANDLLAEASVVEMPRTAEGIAEFGVRCALCTPGSVDDLLLEEARVPGSAADARDAATEAAADGAEPVFAAPPAPRSLPVARLSYSALESYHRCGYRFYLERVARLSGPVAAPAAPIAMSTNGQLVLDVAGAEEEPPPPEPFGVSALLRGSIVHELLERIDFAQAAAPEPSEVEERLRAHGAPADPAEVERIRELIQGFATSALCARVAAGSGVRRELGFAFELDADPVAARSVLVNGVVDVHVEEPEGTLIVDYKTDPLEGEEPETIVAERYATQRLVYALAALRSGAPRVEVAYSFLEAPDEPVSSSFEAADVASLEESLRELAAGVLAGRFEPTDLPHRELCLTCPGRQALCKWGPELTLRERPEPALRS